MLPVNLKNINIKNKQHRRRYYSRYGRVYALGVKMKTLYKNCKEKIGSYPCVTIPATREGDPKDNVIAGRRGEIRMHGLDRVRAIVALPNGNEKIKVFNIKHLARAYALIEGITHLLDQLPYANNPNKKHEREPAS